MYKKLLLATDGSELSQKAHQHAIDLARLCAAELIVLRIVPHFTRSYYEGAVAFDADIATQTEQKWMHQAQTDVQTIVDNAITQKTNAKSMVIKSESISDSIVHLAKEQHCDLIIMASHGRKGLQRLLLGSETQHVLTHSHIPVLVLR